MQTTIKVTEGHVAIWGALEPAISIGSVPCDPGKVHVHHRDDDAADKDIDRSYDLVYLRHGDRELTVEGTAAVAYSISELTGRTMTPLKCPHCGGLHIDELKFATFPHRKHLCNSCGRNFRDRSGPSVSNPLAEAYEALGLNRPPQAPSHIERPLKLESASYGGVALWPSNSAIVNTMARPEEAGIHVHAWDLTGEQVIDDTFSMVWLDGRFDPAIPWAGHGRLAARAIARQDRCPVCKRPLHGECAQVDLVDLPSTTHTCGNCGQVIKTRRRVFLNPLAEMDD